nr:L,D-transpeptidase [uncultured Halomonas sp.]
MKRIKRGLLLCLWLLLPMLGTSANATQGEIWLLVDGASSTLHVYRGEREIERFHPIALGRAGMTELHLRGDSKTPTGEFRINWINYDSDFDIFLGLDYPTLEHAREAEKRGLFSTEAFNDYLSYYRRHGNPPQNTVLGGSIGIHGLGEGDPRIHAQFNWTEGCVAVTNPQIEKLASWVELGTKVIIR